MKKNIKKIIPMVAIATLMTTSVFANTNTQPEKVVVKENNKISGLITEVSKDSNKITIDGKEVNIGKFTLVIDAVKGTSIKYDEIMENQSAYVYNVGDDSIIIANIPQDFKAPIVVTVSETKKIDDSTLEITIKEDNAKYIINKDTNFNCIFAYGTPGIKSMPTFDELVEGSKIVIYPNEDKQLEKCFLTTFKNEVKEEDNNVELETKSNQIYIDGQLLEGANIIQENGKNLMPVRSIFEKLGYQISYDANTKIISMTKGAHFITFATNADAYTFARMAPQPLGQVPIVKDGITYVPVELFELMGIEVNVTSNNSLYIGEKVKETSNIEENKQEVKEEKSNTKKDQIIITEIDEKNNTITVKDDKKGTIVLNTKDLEVQFTNGEKSLYVGQALDVEYGEIMTASQPPINTPKSVKVVDKFSYGEVLNVEKDDKGNTRVLFKDEEIGEVVLNLAPDFKVNFTTEDKELKKGQDLEVVLGKAMTMSLPPMTNPTSVSVINLDENNNKENKGETNQDVLKGNATIKKVDKENKTILVEDEKMGEVVLNIHDDLKIEYKNGVGMHAYNWMVEGQKLEVEYSPIMTRSLPPINNPIKILVLN